jgi:23S rRNA (cytosine1962-C5)-methyltransferase
MLTVQTPDQWRDYELLDSGGEAKLERWGQFLTIRPDPRAIWTKTMSATEWNKADGVFEAGEEGGVWKYKNNPPEPWQISYKSMRFDLKPTIFKHVGLFPEQAVNWEWIQEAIQQKKSSKVLKILNLFAYTGGATLAAATVGAHVTHVDSSRPAMMWASQNAKLSSVGKDQVRWIQDDAIKFVKREIRRGIKYDGIIMDPPRFGRGTKGEVWKLLSDLPELVNDCKQILDSSPTLFLINAYTADVSSLVLQYLLEGVFPNSQKVESGELGLRETASGKVLPAGIFSRWKNST